MKGMLVIISGPSGSGKGTVVKKLDYAMSISVTTRKKRKGERHGMDYFFISEEEFADMRENDEFLEHIQYVGNYYGTPRRYVEDKIDKGEVVVLEIDVIGALQIKEKFPETVLVFLIPPTLDELVRRLAFRNTESLTEIEGRMLRALDEIDLIDKYDYLVINDDLIKAISEINTIVNAEYLKPHRSKSRIDRLRLKNKSEKNM